MTLPQAPLPGAGREQRIPVFALLCAVCFGSVCVSPWLGRSRGQVAVAGTSLSCRTRGRRAGGSELLQRRRKPRVPPKQSGHTLVMVHRKSFPAAPSAWFAVKTFLLGTNCTSWGRENQRKGKKKRKGKRKKPDC